MDALMAAFVAALFAQASDRTPWLAAILADRYRAGGVIAGAVIAIAATSAIAAIGGAWIAPMLTPNAKAMLLAFALLSAGFGAFFGGKAPDRLEGWRLGGFVTASLGLFILDVGDRTPFLTMAFAAKSAHPAFAAVGGALGSLAVIVPMALLGEEERVRLPLKPARLAIGGVFLIVGLFVGLGALGIA